MEPIGNWHTMWPINVRKLKEWDGSFQNMVGSGCKDEDDNPCRIFVSDEDEDDVVFVKDGTNLLPSLKLT